MNSRAFRRRKITHPDDARGPEGELEVVRILRIVLEPEEGVDG